MVALIIAILALVGAILSIKHNTNTGGFLWLGIGIFLIMVCIGGVIIAFGI